MSGQETVLIHKQEWITVDDLKEPYSKWVDRFEEELPKAQIQYVEDYAIA